MSYTNFKINLYAEGVEEPFAVFELPYKEYNINIGLTTSAIANNDYHSVQIIYPNYNVNSQLKNILNNIKDADLQHKKFIEILLSDDSDNFITLLEKCRITYKAYDLENVVEDIPTNEMVLREMLKIESSSNL